MEEDIRTYARMQLGIQHGMTRAEYVAAVRKYAIEKHGETEDVKRHAERTARHVWDSTQALRG